VVTLANNHILDYGAKGLLDTFESLRQNKIDYVGAGNNLNEANQPLALEKDGVRIAILNFCENEWSIAEEDKPGANPMDIIDNINQIKAAKATHDKVICIIHGGHEYYPLPSPRMVKLYRFYAECGVNALICHHAHCYSGYEIYQDVPIVYSLGNMVFTKNNKSPEWYQGQLVILEIEVGSPVELNLIPIEQSNDFHVSLMEKDSKNKALQKVQYFKSIIEDNDILQKEWLKFVNNKSRILDVIFPISFLSGKYLRNIFRKLGINKKFINKDYIKYIINYFRCEAHRDIMLELLKKQLEE